MELTTLHVNMNELEAAFDGSIDDGWRHWLDRKTGDVISIPNDRGLIPEEDREQIEQIDENPGRFLRVEPFSHLTSPHEARAFAATVEEQKLRDGLLEALAARRGAIRNFLDALHDDPGEWERWHRERRNQIRARIAEFLRERGIVISYDPIPEPPSARDHLLASAVEFLERARNIRGVERIALIGSLTTAKKQPKDVDILVTITPDADLDALAAAGRRLAGHNQQINRGADVFLADQSGRYLGRTCPWKRCDFGERMRCGGTRCGTRIRDDFAAVKLDRAVIAAPPVELWPVPSVRAVGVPDDVRAAFGLSGK